MHHMSQTNWARRSYDVASNVHHIDWLKTRGKLANIIRREKHTGWISALSKSGGSKDEDCPSTREHAQSGDKHRNYKRPKRFRLLKPTGIDHLDLSRS